MEDFIKILGVLAILAITYIAMAVYRRLIRNQENKVWRRLIPMWAMLIGVGLGILFFANVPEIMPTAGLLTSMFVGGIAGWAAVGANQFAKLTFGEGRRRAVIKAEKVIIKEDKPVEKPTETQPEDDEEDSV